MSDVARNIELVEKLERAYNERDYDTVRACVAADFVANTPGAEMVPAGVEGAIASNEGAFSFFSDKRSEILEIFGDGDRESGPWILCRRPTAAGQGAGPAGPSCP